MCRALSPRITEREQALPERRQPDRSAGAFELGGHHHLVVFLGPSDPVKFEEDDDGEDER